MKKTALITGCNRGLGKTLMNAFAADGYDIIALVRNMDKLTLKKRLMLCSSKALTFFPYV